MIWGQFVVSRQRLIFCMNLYVYCPIKEVVQSSSKGVISRNKLLLYHYTPKIKTKSRCRVSSGWADQWKVGEWLGCGLNIFCPILCNSPATNICNIAGPGRIPSGEDLHSIEGRRLIIQRKSLAGGSSRRANLTRSCRAITLHVSTNTDDGNSAFQRLPVETCTDGNCLPLGGLTK